jgi:hypothetical protein
MFFWTLFFALAAVLSAAEATILDRTHESQVFGETRNYRIFLPPDYETSGKRYPVIYFFHGFGQRFNRSNFDDGAAWGGDTIAAYVAKHDVIVARWDGYNPRKPNEVYARPYNISPVETERQFPLYFPEFVRHIDATYRTIADREHRATAGLSMGGFMSYWVSGKYPHLVSSASNFMGSSEFRVGPRGFDVEYRHDEMYGNYEGLRTRIILGSKDFIQFYHRRMNAVWAWTRPHHESEEFPAEHGTPGMARTLDFHMRAFADPLPPPEVWSHAEVYPDFEVWGWQVSSDRRAPGITALEGVSRSGFRSAVRTWLPAGSTLPEVKLAVTTAPLFAAGETLPVTLIRLRDGRMERRRLTADGQGRLKIELDGDEYEVGVGKAAIPALAGWRIEGAAWATAGAPVKLKVRFWNKGAAGASPTAMIWESPNPGVRFERAAFTAPALAPGKSTEVPLTFTVSDPGREIVRLFAVAGARRLLLDVPLLPPADKAADFKIADGGEYRVFERAVQVGQKRLGEGNGNGQAEAGETVLVLLPDQDALRGAELFTNDACVETRRRISDVWSPYDHVGASAKYTQVAIRPGCPAGHVVRMMARVQLPDKPNHKLRYAVIEMPVSGSHTTK